MEIRRERDCVDRHQGNARLQARESEQWPCGRAHAQLRVRVWHYEFQFAAEGVRAQLAGVNSKFAATLHSHHLKQE